MMRKFKKVVLQIFCSLKFNAFKNNFVLKYKIFSGVLEFFAFIKHQCPSDDHSYYLIKTDWEQTITHIFKQFCRLTLENAFIGICCGLDLSVIHSCFTQNNRLRVQHNATFFAQVSENDELHTICRHIQSIMLSAHKHNNQ